MWRGRSSGRDYSNLFILFLQQMLSSAIERKGVASAIKKQKREVIIFRVLLKNVNIFYMNYALIRSLRKGCLSQQQGNGSSHARGDWDKILLYLIKCSLAPCSGYLGKQKQ